MARRQNIAELHATLDVSLVVQNLVVFSFYLALNICKSICDTTFLSTIFNSIRF